MRYEAEYFDEKKRLLRAIFNETLAQCNDAFHRKNISKGQFHYLVNFISGFQMMHLSVGKIIPAEN